MRFHKAHLTRRLILDTSADSEKEENMVEWYFSYIFFSMLLITMSTMINYFDRLREVGMPADYVHKLARMFQDIKISEDLNQQFKEEYRKTKGSIAGKILSI